MNKKNILMALAISALTLGTAGCSLVDKVTKKSDSQEKGTPGWVDTSENAASGAAEKVKDAAKKIGGRVKKTAEEAVAKVNEKLEGTTEDVQSNISGDWAIETVMGKKAVGETVPFIKFAPDEKRIYGNNGCNVINAQYDINAAKGTISFSNLATTMMLCADTNITDAEVGQALGMTAKYTLVEGEPDKTLTFYDANGKEVMTLMHRDFHFLDGTWAVVAIDGEKVDIDGMKIALDVDEKHLHGNTGCNIINGELETDMDTPNSISFSKIGMTRMACPNSGWETRMTMALEEAVTAKRISKDEIEFIGSNGQQVMLLKRTSPIEE